MRIDRVSNTLYWAETDTGEMLGEISGKPEIVDAIAGILDAARRFNYAIKQQEQEQAILDLKDNFEKLDGKPTLKRRTK